MAARLVLTRTDSLAGAQVLLPVVGDPHTSGPAGRDKISWQSAQRTVGWPSEAAEYSRAVRPLSAAGQYCGRLSASVPPTTGRGSSGLRLTALSSLQEPAGLTTPSRRCRRSRSGASAVCRLLGPGRLFTIRRIGVRRRSRYYRLGGFWGRASPRTDSDHALPCLLGCLHGLRLFQREAFRHLISSPSALLLRAAPPPRPVRSVYMGAIYLFSESISIYRSMYLCIYICI
jgi:hypothetical protein